MASSTGNGYVDLIYIFLLLVNLFLNDPDGIFGMLMVVGLVTDGCGVFWFAPN